MLFFYWNIISSETDPCALHLIKKKKKNEMEKQILAIFPFWDLVKGKRLFFPKTFAFPTKKIDLDLDFFSWIS